MNVKKLILVFLLGICVTIGVCLVLIKLHIIFRPTIVNTPLPSPTQVTTPAPPVKNTSPEFGKAVTLTLDKKVTFSDGLAVVLTNMDDSRCPKNVECIWAGELSATLEISGGTIKYPGEVHVSTVTNQTTDVENYKVSLSSATTKTATIIVTKKP